MAEPDQIYERYLARAIRAMNALGDDLTASDDEVEPLAAPVLGSGHPLADIMLLKTRAQPAPIPLAPPVTTTTRSVKRMGTRRAD